MLFGKLSFLAPFVVWTAGVAALAQGPAYHLGRTPTPEEIQALDISIGPEGKELPPGSGTAREGAKLYAERCAQCHGPTGAERAVYHRPLVGGKGSLTTLQPVKTIGNYWAFATTIWDYIRRAMPLDKPGSLRVDDVYALTAFLLYRNEIVREDDVLNATNLPQIQMPGRKLFFPAEPDWKPGYRQLYFSSQPEPRERRR